MYKAIFTTLFTLALLSACGPANNQGTSPSPSPSASASTGAQVSAKVWNENELDGAITCMTSKYPNDAAAASVRAQFNVNQGQKGSLTAGQFQATLNTLGEALVKAEANRGGASSGCIK